MSTTTRQNGRTNGAAKRTQRAATRKAQREYLAALVERCRAIASLWQWGDEPEDTSESDDDNWYTVRQDMMHFSVNGGRMHEPVPSAKVGMTATHQDAMLSGDMLGDACKYVESVMHACVNFLLRAEDARKANPEAWQPIPAWDGEWPNMPVDRKPYGSEWQEQYPDKAKICRRLSALTGKAIRVDYCPTDFLDGDEDASGHLYDATKNTPGGMELMTLDDRRREPLEVQLAEECRRVAAKYESLSRRVLGLPSDEPDGIYGVYIHDKDGTCRPYENGMTSREADAFVNAYNAINTRTDPKTGKTQTTGTHAEKRPIVWQPAESAAAE